MQLATTSRREDIGQRSDEQLVGDARRGDEEATRALIGRNNRRLFRIARSIVGNDEEAEDVVQETYVRAFTRLDGFRGQSRFSTWLTRIALNEAMGRMRRRRPMTGLDLLDSLPETASVIRFPHSLAPEAADAALGRSQVRELLELTIDSLPGAFRTVFILRVIEEMSTEETAESLSLRPETVKTRLHRARRLLRSAIENELQAGFADLFPFDGARCTAIADRVVERLRRRNP
jgi:RNA polymerase sigma-70 factor (ECF subfamily)